MDRFSFESRAALPPVAHAAREYLSSFTLAPRWRDFPPKVRGPVSLLSRGLGSVRCRLFDCRLGSVIYRYDVQVLKSPEPFKCSRKMSLVCIEGYAVLAVGCRWCFGKVPLLNGGRRHCSYPYLDVVPS